MSGKLTRMSIDVSPKEHKKIKIQAAVSGTSIREFVIKCIREQIDPGAEKKSLN